jgi:hypothetical protein
MSPLQHKGNSCNFCAQNTRTKNAVLDSKSTPHLMSATAPSMARKALRVVGKRIFAPAEVLLHKSRLGRKKTG